MFKVELNDYGYLVVSESTCNPEYLIPAFLSFLSDYTDTEAEDREIQELFTEYEAYKAMEYREGCEFMAELYDVIYSMMEKIAPENAYFGSSEGDGTCIGFWTDTENDF